MRMAKGDRYVRHKSREVCAMQDATTVLSVIQSRGMKKQPLERLYRQLFNIDLYKAAYAQVYANDGATTPGTDDTPNYAMSSIGGRLHGESTSRRNGAEEDR